MRTRVRRIWRGWYGYARLMFLTVLQYRVAVLSSAALSVVWILLLTRVWTAVYGERGLVEGFDLETLIVYLTLVNLQNVIMSNSVTRIITERVRVGTVLFDIARPMPLISQLIAQQAGQSVGVCGFVLLAAPFAALVGGLAPPADLGAAVTYPVALTLGWLINTLLAILVGLATFWAMEIGGFTLLYQVVAGFLSGTSVPVVFFPGVFGVIVELLPFRFTGYVPAAVYVGQIDGVAVLRTMGWAVVWIVLLGGLLALVWGRAYRKVVVQGG